MLRGEMYFLHDLTRISCINCHSNSIVTRVSDSTRKGGDPYFVHIVMNLCMILPSKLAEILSREAVLQCHQKMSGITNI